MTRFVLASGNAHKLGEFGAILAPFAVEPMPRHVRLPEEGAVSFLANAAVKARVLAEALRAAQPAEGGVGEGPHALPSDGLSAAGGLIAIGDDSGLEVEAIGWAPGIVSARYAGRDGAGADVANYERLLRELSGVTGPEARRARFTCALVAVAADLSEYAVTGHWWGSIAEGPQGEGGFGYDPVFVPEGSALSVAEWPQREKDAASHRGLAGAALLDLLRRRGVLPSGRR
jgi:XTP/dITP diphosphohydrolase